jgi:hypothetical protein
MTHLGADQNASSRRFPYHEIAARTRKDVASGGQKTFVSRKKGLSTSLRKKEKTVLACVFHSNICRLSLNRSDPIPRTMRSLVLFWQTTAALLVVCLWAISGEAAAVSKCVPLKMGFMQETTTKKPCPPGFYADAKYGCRINLKPAAPKSEPDDDNQEDHIINAPIKCAEGFQVDYRGRCRAKWGN